MNNEKIVDVCKRISKSVNSLNDIYYTSESLQKELKSLCCPYYIRASGVVLKSGVSLAKEGRTISFKINKPVHYSQFIPTIRKRFEQRLMSKNYTSTRNEDDTKEIELENFLNIHTFSDSELVKELRDRGFEVSATKKIEL